MNEVSGKSSKKEYKKPELFQLDDVQSKGTCESGSSNQSECSVGNIASVCYSGGDHVA